MLMLEDVDARRCWCLKMLMLMRWCWWVMIFFFI